MAYKFHDFDAQFSEMKKEKLYFQVFGKKYWIYKRIPAILPLEMARRENNEEIDTKTLISAAYTLFGEKNLKEWEKHQEFTVDMLGDMIKWAFEAINGVLDKSQEISDDEPPEEQGKN